MASGLDKQAVAFRSVRPWLLDIEEGPDGVVPDHMWSFHHFKNASPPEIAASFIRFAELSTLFRSCCQYPKLRGAEEYLKTKILCCIDFLAGSSAATWAFKCVTHMEAAPCAEDSSHSACICTQTPAGEMQQEHARRLAALAAHLAPEHATEKPRGLVPEVRCKLSTRVSWLLLDARCEF